MAVSQNGWPINPPRSARTIPGTVTRVTVADGPAGDVLMWVLAQFDARVEDIDLNSTRGEYDDWGYANRNVRGSTSVSNHASATAVDINATRHVLGARNTFTAAQVAEIHRILAEVDHVVRWGGDYSGRKDEMHFEINAGHAAVAAVAAQLKEDDVTPNDVWSAEVWHRYANTPEGKALAESLGGRPGDLVEEHTAGEWITAMAVRTAVIERELGEVRARLDTILAKLGGRS